MKNEDTRGPGFCVNTLALVEAEAQARSVRRPRQAQVDVLAKTNEATIARRLREFQLDLADRVAAGELTDLQANELANDFADRLNRDGAWS